ncbi:FRG domain-containing protein [Clostridium botulinum]|uniref:FRG domain-containing protein n=1 Tax=Clostridium botulinum TaxID=1491 RepID=UPI00217DF9AD|nr:FRG domain-containing protein [Clostridium botulinum]
MDEKMGKEKRYKIGSISQYLDVIRGNDLKDYILRGQNEPFYGIEASLFRKYKGSWDNDKIYNLEVIINEYYKRIISRLTTDERNNFLAFCQHHGIPTNLVDFSYSPLVALFFACYGKDSPKFTLNDLVGTMSYEQLLDDKSAQGMLIHNLCNRLSKKDISEYAEVYLIKKKRLIDITEIILENNYNNIFDALLNDNEIQLKIYNKIYQVFPKENDEISLWLNNIIDCYNMNKCTIDGLLSRLNEDKEIENIKQYKNKINNNFKKGIKELYIYIKENTFDDIERNIFYSMDYEFELDSEFVFDNIDYSVIGSKIYMELLINILKIFAYFKEKLFISLDIYFVYQCPNIFDRISNQKGLFVQQPYLYYVEDVYNYHVLSFQEIIPDITIEIENYNEILKELEYLGVGLDYIYNDFDSIAKFVKDNN